MLRLCLWLPFYDTRNDHTAIPCNLMKLWATVERKWIGYVAHSRISISWLHCNVACQTCTCKGYKSKTWTRFSIDLRKTTMMFGQSICRAILYKMSFVAITIKIFPEGNVWVGTVSVLMKVMHTILSKIHWHWMYQNFLHRRSPSCRKRNQGIHNRVKGKQCQFTKFFK